MDANTVLDICYQVRVQLVKNGVENLGLDFPIVPMKHLGVIQDGHYLGYAHFSCAGEWEMIDETRMQAKNIVVDSVEMCITDPTTNEVYCLERILPTLLHEFAHCITPSVREYGRDEGGKHKRKWVHVEHSEEFYDNFSHILDIAEMLGIYKLPPGFSKNNRISLKRFDHVDMDAKNVVFGTTNLLSPAAAPSPPSTSQNVTVLNDKGISKLLVLKGDQGLLDELKDACLKKFQVKKKKAGLQMMTIKGEVIEDDDSLLKVLEKKEQVKFRLV